MLPLRSCRNLLPALIVSAPLFAATLPQDFRGSSAVPSLDTLVPKGMREDWGAQWRLRLDARRDMGWKGEVLLSDEADAYLSAVLDSALAKQPALRARLRVHVSPSPFVNAYVLTDGMIMVNQGMLARLRTESQLAMVLAHEASHYWFHHLVDEWVEEQRNRSFWSWGDVSERWERTRLQHSREREMQADSMAVAYLSGSGYSGASLDSLYVMLGNSDNALGTRAWDRSAVQGLEVGWGSDAWMDVSLARSAPVEEEDSLRTHPAIPKRREALTRLAAKMSGAGREFLVSKERFERLCRKAQLDLPARFLETNQPAAAVFEAWSLLARESRNRAVRQVMARGLVELAMEKAAIRNATARARRIRSFGAYQTFENFLEHSPGLLLPCLAVDQMRRLERDGMADSLDAALLRELWAVLPKAWPRQMEVVRGTGTELPRSLRAQKASLEAQKSALQPLPAGNWELPDTVAGTVPPAKGVRIVVLPVQWGQSPKVLRLGDRDSARRILGGSVRKELVKAGHGAELVDPLDWKPGNAEEVEELGRVVGWLRERMDPRGPSRFRPRLEVLRGFLARHKAEGLLLVGADLAPTGDAAQTLYPIGVSLWGNPEKVWNDPEPSLLAAYFEPGAGMSCNASLVTSSKPTKDGIEKDVAKLVKVLLAPPEPARKAFSFRSGD